MEKILWNIETGKGKMRDIDLLWDIQRKIEGNTICPLGDAAAWPVAAATSRSSEASCVVLNLQFAAIIFLSVISFSPPARAER